MEEFKTQGNDFFKNQSYQKAIECYDKGLKLEPNNAILLSNKTAAFIKSGEIKKAIQSAALSTKADPNWAKAWNRLGSALLLDNQFDKARLALQKSLQLDSANKITINLIADLDKREKLLNTKKEKITLNKDDDTEEEENTEEEVVESIDTAKLSPDPNQIPNMAMPPMPQQMQQMQQMQPMFQQMMQNPKLMAKMSDQSFQQKVLSMQENPLGAMGDPEMMEVMQMMMGGINLS